MSMNVSFDSISPKTPLSSNEGVNQTNENSLRVNPSSESEQLAKTVKQLKLKESEGETLSISEKQLVRLVEQSNKAMSLSSTSLEYSVHEVTNDIMVKVLNKETGELIREVPPEKIVNLLAKSLEMAGIIIDERR
ncbi:flagellar protein FlaG [Chengkuizengella sediminis]|uniref:flagellar protein FlaG n=1 Tax=Chengkuizengella sediminis TaxID=1885917 RepID=UPI001F0EFBE8|nr:flagellar protein FlaG [Chengkuizengella sediminis]